MSDPTSVLAFPTTGIPIVGQPFALKSWFPTAVIICHCSEAREPILIVGGAPSVCPACGRGYVIATVTYTHGQAPQIGIGIVTRPEGSTS